MPARVPRLPDPAPALDDPERKRRYNRRLFDLIAPRYDRFTRWFSFGMDATWKRRLARAVRRHLPPDAVVLDLACGTGDLAEMVRRTGGRVIGVDASVAMLHAAHQRFAVPPSARPPVRLIRGDMTSLPLAGSSVHAVTVGYGLRNAPDLDAALREMARVLRPGGVLATLDFFLPSNRVWRWWFLWYLRRAGRLLGRWWHGEPHAYGYIEASLRPWMTATQLTERFVAHGFRVDAEARYLLGGIGLHVSRRGERA